MRGLFHDFHHKKMSLQNSVHCRRVQTDTYSKGKYASVIQQCGGWAWFQKLLGALDGIAKKHGSDIATVSARWVLQQPQVWTRAK